MPSRTPPSSYIVLDDQARSTARFYQNPVDIIQVDAPSEIEAAFAQIADYQQRGFYLAGYASYELGYVLEPKLAPLLPPARRMPLLQFGVFEAYAPQLPARFTRRLDAPNLKLNPLWSRAEYKQRFESVLDYIRAGDVYQINLSFPMRGRYCGPLDTLYAGLRRRQPGRYGGIVHLGETDILSLSPELFFERNGTDMVMRPMKGTIARSPDPDEDIRLKISMRDDVKSQAENLMIVDLLRNDVSRIAAPGSVEVPELFHLETYPTLHTMTSSITATLTPQTSLRDIFHSLFPCGSVTGAPKIRAMEIIHELEERPRGAYCGALGYIDPDGTACFNVAIRTLTRRGSQIDYPVGSGVVLDSHADGEYEECVLKAQVLTPPAPDIIETCLWTPNGGVQRQAAHIKRMLRAAKALGYPINPAHIQAQFQNLSGETPQRIRLSLAENGEITLIATPYTPRSAPFHIALSQYPLTSHVQRTDHKLSSRAFYDGERERVAELCGCDEVIFTNMAGELCEGSFTSLFIEKDGVLMTPHIDCGLLPGILRAEMIHEARVQERILTPTDLLTADKIFVGNSLRGLCPAVLCTPDPL